VGDARRLSQWGAQLGFSLDAVALVGNGQRFSSSSVRRALVDGDIARASEVLGHAVLLRGTVRHGDARGGAELGYPTANLALASHQALAALGIYAGAARLRDGRVFPAAISVGKRPQFYDDGDVLVEAYLEGFSGDLYGQVLDLVFLARLRGEAKFSSTQALIDQMGIDTTKTIEIFDSFPNEPQELLEFIFGQRR
jgi:riboflavin kinase/FMN adenylyltransferase